MKTTTILSKTKAASTEQLGFTDGMLVTADDLTAATRYPLDVFQVLTRAYFGCGIVCGLKLGPDSRGAAFVDDKRAASDDEGSFVVEVGAGVALDCHGFPLEICGPLRIDLSPDPCACDEPPKELCLAIRRTTAKAAKARSCGCNCGGDCGCGCSGPGESGQCSRIRDGVEVRAFPPDDLPENTCRNEPKEPPTDQPKYPNGQRERPTTDAVDAAVPEGAAPAAAPANASVITTSRRDAICDCLKECGDYSCCGESWVLLGCVLLDDRGVTRIDLRERQYVKPIECLCSELDEQRVVVRQQADDIRRLSVAVEELQAARKPTNRPR